MKNSIEAKRGHMPSATKIPAQAPLLESENTARIEDQPEIDEESPRMELQGENAVEMIHDQEEVKHEEPVESEDVPMIFTPSDFVDFQNDGISGTSPEPKAEFSYAVGKFLSIIKDIVFAHTVAFFWVKHESDELVLEGKITEGHSFASQRRFALGEDLASQIADTGQPKVLNQIPENAEMDMLHYYVAPEGVRSFVGVPVYYPKENGHTSPIGVLIADSKAEDAFGRETLALLGQFTKIISSLLRGSTEKYDLIIDAEFYKADRRFWAKAFADSSVSITINALMEETAKLIPWDALTVTLFDEGLKQWALANVRVRAHDRYVVAKQVIDFQKSVVGNAIRLNKIQQISDLSKTSGVRFLNDELSLGITWNGSFAAIPISTHAKCYGAVTMESRDRNVYTSRETSVVHHLASIAAAALELNEANEIIKEFVVVDDTTGVYQKKFFMQRLDEELQRAEDTGDDVALVLLSVASFADVRAQYGRNGADAALNRIASILRSSTRAYDVVGKCGQSLFGVVLVNTTANDAYLWAEKVRPAIASSVITLDQKTFSVTTTIGVCGATEGATTDELFANAGQVLEKAVEAGGNIVRVF
jgi:diguanylate cyclase (GGDEF)-like protein